ncbi:MAG: SIMPL domain-containing protein [Bacteroidota bacterium]
MKTLISSLIIMLVATGVAQQEKPEAARTVTVQGLGKLMTVPDQVRLNVQVNTRAETATEAMTQASKKTNDILAILKGYGVDPKDIQTSRVTVSAILDYQRNIQPPPIVGYGGVNEFTVLFKGKLMEKVGEFLDKAVVAGVTSFSGLMYESSKQRDLEREALKRAAADAQARADVLAKELGATLGRVMTISESVNAPMPIMRAAMMDAASAAAPVMTGEMSINAQVTVTFELK